MRRLLIPLASLATGCAGLAPGAPAGAQGLPLEQRVDAIPVLDAAGTPYPYPFAGGFGSAAGYLSPKPQLIDLVGDARPDLVLTEGGGAIALYENVAGGVGFGFRWRTDFLAGIAPGAWFRFGDMDGDGDADLLASAGPAIMRYWRNDGPGGDGLPQLSLVADPLLAADGVTEVTTEDNSVPALFDAVRRIARAVERALDADGTFVAINNRVSQSVPHLHVHVVPRRKKDGLRGFFWPRQRYDSDTERRLTASAIARALADKA